MKPALVVLAAGASRRLGRCKALVELDGRSVLERLLEAGACLDETPPLVITGAHHAEIASATPAGVQVLRNADWERGRSGGVRLAHQARPGRALCLTPVDVPLVPRRVFEALAQFWDDLGGPSLGWLAPRLEAPGDPRHGRHGHPVVAGPGLLDLLEGASPDLPLRRLRARASPLAAVGVFNPEVLDDLDDGDDLERLGRRSGGR